MAAIFDAKNPEDFASRVSKVVKSCGFESYMIALQLKGVDGRAIRNVTTSYPDEWMQIYAAGQYEFKDPAVRHCQTTTDPFVWRDDAFNSVGAQELLEEAQSFGVSHGVSVSVHERSGRKSMLSLVRDQSFQNDPRESARMIAYSRILSSCIHVVASRLIAPAIEEQGRPRLSKRKQSAFSGLHGAKRHGKLGKS